MTSMSLRSVFTKVILATGVASAVFVFSLWRGSAVAEPVAAPAQPDGSAAKAPEKKKPQPARKAKRTSAYNAAAVDADPEYCKTVDAERILQRAAAPENGRLPELKFVGDPLRYASPKSTLDKPLAVRSVPGRPVTFLATDGGVFANDCHCITVRADAEGVARAEFRVGEIGTYRVQVNCPENAGPLTVLIKCLSDADLAELFSGEAAQRHRENLKALDEKRRLQAAELDKRLADGEAALKKAAEEKAKAPPASPPTDD